MASRYKDVEDTIFAISDDDINRYSEYWTSIKPEDHKEYYKRWLFSFLSVHTTWQKNVSSYQELVDKPIPASKTELFNVIHNTKVGLTNMRTNGIWQFHNDFWQAPDSWYRQENESWVDFRNRVMNQVNGLALAKTSFVLEMAYPATCEVVCLDTHMLQLYKATKKGSALTDKSYRRMEKHWIKTCKQRNVPSAIARHIFWDKKQGKQDTRYWSFVFEQTKELDSITTTNSDTTHVYSDSEKETSPQIETYADTSATSEEESTSKEQTIPQLVEA